MGPRMAGASSIIEFKKYGDAAGKEEARSQSQKRRARERDGLRSAGVKRGQLDSSQESQSVRVNQTNPIDALEGCTM